MSDASNHFYHAMQTGDHQEAAKLFCTLPLSDQAEILRTLGENPLVGQNPATSKPSVIALLQRELKENTSFEDFYDAWQPEASSQQLDDRHNAFDYYQIPVRVINARSVDDPNKIISIGMIACDNYDDVLEEFTQRLDEEKARAKRIEGIANKLADNEMFEVVSDDLLGK